MSESPKGQEVATQDDARRSRTPAVVQKERLDKFMAALDLRQQQLGTLLSDSGIDPKRFLEVARRALALDPGLVQHDHGALMQAFVNAATDGLLPDKRQGAIVVYGGKPAWVPMVQGLLEVAYRSGNFKSIEARVVYDGDFFEYELGDDPWIKHRPKARPAGQPPRPIIAAYAVAKTVNGGIFREIFEPEDIRKVAAVSKSVNGPAKNWLEEMTRKGPLRRMWKYLPKSDQMNQLADRDNDIYDLEDNDATPEPERKIAPGFAPKAPPALQQGADPVMDPIDGREYAPAEQGENQSSDESGQLEQRAEPRDDGEDEFADIAGAKTWPAVKQYVRTRAKAAAWSDLVYRDVVMGRVWERVAHQDSLPVFPIPDVVTDVVLFEAWLVGSGAGAAEIDANWAIVQELGEFKKLNPAEQKLLATAVEEIKAL